jgi:hypothetical protein
MNYQKIYDNLILSRGKEPLRKDEYYEQHHIIPKCLGGSDDKQNLIFLTYREHFIAHLLLTKIYPDHRGINYAILCMLRKHKHQRVITSKVYETIKKNFSKFKKLYCTIQNPGKSENSRNSARKRMTERNPISLDPSKNRTSQPIRIYFEDGTTKDYKYAKEFCNISGVPYSTMKVWLKNNSGYSKKHKILKIERLKK